MNLKIIENISLESSTLKFDTTQLLIEYYKKEGHNIFSASALAEKNIRQFNDFANSIISSSLSKNEVCLFSDVSNNITNINGSYFEVKEIREQLYKLTWQEFEDFCSNLIKKSFGGTKMEVTQRTNDMGLDFSGLIPFKSNHFAKPLSYIEVYGQVKKYEAKINRIDVDKFTAFANRQKRDNTYPAQLFIFCTTSDFNPNAKEEIRQNNFISLNGFQIASLVYLEAKEKGLKAIKEFL